MTYWNKLIVYRWIWLLFFKNLTMEFKSFCKKELCTLIHILKGLLCSLCNVIFHFVKKVNLLVRKFAFLAKIFVCRNYWYFTEIFHNPWSFPQSWISEIIEITTFHHAHAQARKCKLSTFDVLHTTHPPPQIFGHLKLSLKLFIRFRKFGCLAS